MGVMGISSTRLPSWSFSEPRWAPRGDFQLIHASAQVHAHILLGEGCPSPWNGCCGRSWLSSLEYTNLKCVRNR